MYFFYQDQILFYKEKPYFSKIIPFYNTIIKTSPEFCWLNEKYLHDDYAWRSIYELNHISNSLELIICKAQAERFEIMPRFASILKNSPHEIKAEGRALFFPGSFNPFHKGHLQCVEVLDQPALIIPDYNPQKEFNKKEAPWSLCQQIKKELPNHHQIYPGFLLKKQSNPTSKWIEAIKAKLPHQKLELVMGADSFNSLHRWIEYEALLNNLDQLHIVARTEETWQQKREITDRFPLLKLSFYMHNPYQEVSSSKIRQTLIDEIKKQR